MKWNVLADTSNMILLNEWSSNSELFRWINCSTDILLFLKNSYIR